VTAPLVLLQGDKSMAGRRALQNLDGGGGSVGGTLRSVNEEGKEVDDEEADPGFYGSMLRKLYPGTVLQPRERG
jgi:hypothetical protein